MKYELSDEGRIVAGARTNTGVLRFGADDVRRERTGVHARVFIAFDRQVLAFNQFNVERDEDRTRLANSAWGQLDAGAQADVSKADMKRHLDLYAFGLWDAWLEISTAGTIEETPVDESVPTAVPILPGYIYAGAGTILFGREGGGKTASALLMAVQCDAGVRGPFGTPEGRCPVIFVNLERPALSLRARLARVNKVLGLDSSRPLLMLHGRGRPLRDIMPQLKKAVMARGIEVVFLDSLSRTGSGSLVDDQTGTGVVDLLNSLESAWFAIGHSPRGDDSHLFGTVHFEAGADLALSLTSEHKGQTLGVSIVGTKANDVPLTKRRSWAFEFNDSGLVAVRHAADDEFADLEDKAIARLSERARVEMTLTRGAATVYDIVEATGIARPNVLRVLNDKRRYRKVGTKPTARGQAAILYGLVSDLSDEGVSKGVSDTPSETPTKVYQTPESRGLIHDTPFFGASLGPSESRKNGSGPASGPERCITCNVTRAINGEGECNLCASKRYGFAPPLEELPACLKCGTEVLPGRVLCPDCALPAAPQGARP